MNELQKIEGIPTRDLGALTNEDLLVDVRRVSRLAIDAAVKAAELKFLLGMYLKEARERGQEFYHLAGCSGAEDFIADLVRNSPYSRSTITTTAYILDRIPNLDMETFKRVPEASLKWIANHAPESQQGEWIEKASSMPVEQLKREMHTRGHGEEPGYIIQITGPKSQIDIIRAYLESPAWDAVAPPHDFGTKLEALVAFASENGYPNEGN